MAQIFQIHGDNGRVKPNWEEIVCDYADVHPTGLICFYVEDEFAVAYMLAQGESLIYVGEE